MLARAVLLALICGLAGYLSGRFWTGIAAACATASVLVAFTADRPTVVTFLGIAVFVSILETRRFLWWLPPIALLWANCHGGFFLGWIVLLAYALRDRRLWPVCRLYDRGVSHQSERIRGAEDPGGLPQESDDRQPHRVAAPQAVGTALRF